jgi:hypothetical protein
MGDTMKNPVRVCPRCGIALSEVWRYGDFEMGRCTHCGEIPLATVYDAIPNVVACESEFKATAINDGTADFFLRLTRLVPENNVVQLKKMEISANNRRVVPLGVRTNTIDLPSFMNRVKALNLIVELELVGD